MVTVFVVNDKSLLFISSFLLKKQNKKAKRTFKYQAHQFKIASYDKMIIEQVALLEVKQQQTWS